MANEWLNRFNFHKRRHVFSPLQQLIALGGNLTLHPPYSLSNEKIYMNTHLKEELTDFFESCQVYTIPTGRVERVS